MRITLLVVQIARDMLLILNLERLQTLD